MVALNNQSRYLWLVESLLHRLAGTPTKFQVCHRVQAKMLPSNILYSKVTRIIQPLADHL